MSAQPSPEEASAALQEIADRRQKASSANAYPAWTLWVIGALAIAVGVCSDLQPNLSTPLLYVLGASALLLTYLPRRKGVAAAMGYDRLPDSRPVGTSRRAMMLRTVTFLGLMALVVLASTLLRTWDVPYPGTIGSVSVIVTMPLWRWLLNRAAQEPEESRRD